MASATFEVGVGGRSKVGIGVIGRREGCGVVTWLVTVGAGSLDLSPHVVVVEDDAGPGQRINDRGLDLGVVSVEAKAVPPEIVDLQPSHDSSSESVRDVCAGQGQPRKESSQVIKVTEAVHGSGSP